MQARPAAWALALMLAALACPFAPAQKFYPDDPIQEDRDRAPIPLPREIPFSRMADFLVNTFLRRPGPEEPVPEAGNINTLGEVPDSSWFTNRMSRRVMSLAELVQGPNRTSGPTRPWTVIAAKEEGVSPGFTIRDGRGDVYFVKFDPPDHPQMATSAEVIATRFFHAFGYNVPENHLMQCTEQDLTIAPGVDIMEFGRLRAMTRSDLHRIFRKLPRLSNGTFQALASRELPGRPLGHFRFWSTRSDDPSDIFPHENRRELRGLRVFAAWLNHDEATSGNSLDVYVGEEGKGHVMHYLLDFGSCLGSGSVRPNSLRAGNRHAFAWDTALKAGASLGVWEPRYLKLSYPHFPSLGRFESEHFVPRHWKSDYPNPAFERMRPADAFWAARVVQLFSDEMVRAVVKTGELEDARAEEYLTSTLIRRRDKIVRHYLGQLNPLDRFVIEATPQGALLHFANPGLEAGLAGSADYRYQWFRFDNDTRALDPVSGPERALQPRIPLPDDDSPYLMVRITTLAAGQERWQLAVDVYLDPGRRVVGIERQEQ